MNLRRTFTLALAAFGLLAGSATAQLQPGREYALLNPPQATDGAGKVEVIEFFWYGCGHCYKLEPFVEAWAKKLPSDVTFRRVPAVPNQGWGQLALVYYTLEAMGKLDTMHRKVFDAYHADGVILSNRNVRDEWLAKQGIDVKQFTAVERSFAVQSKLSRAQQLTGSYRVEGVPTVVVNGKYVTSATHAGGAERVMEVVDGLIAMSRKDMGLVAEAPKATPVAAKK
jgi:thiol:disulfide interchange protein DsbA